MRKRIYSTPEPAGGRHLSDRDPLHSHGYVQNQKHMIICYPKESNDSYIRNIKTNIVLCLGMIGDDINGT